MIADDLVLFDMDESLFFESLDLCRRVTRFGEGADGNASCLADLRKKPSLCLGGSWAQKHRGISLGRKHGDLLDSARLCFLDDGVRKDQTLFAQDLERRTDVCAKILFEALACDGAMTRDEFKKLFCLAIDVSVLCICPRNG